MDTDLAIKHKDSDLFAATRWQWARYSKYLLLLLLAQAACRAPLLTGADPYDEDEDDEVTEGMRTRANSCSTGTARAGSRGKNENSLAASHATAKLRHYMYRGFAAGWPQGSPLAAQRARPGR